MGKVVLSAEALEAVVALEMMGEGFTDAGYIYGVWDGSRLMWDSFHTAARNAKTRFTYAGGDEDKGWRVVEMSMSPLRLIHKKPNGKWER